MSKNGGFEKEKNEEKFLMRLNGCGRRQKMPAVMTHGVVRGTLSWLKELKSVLDMDSGLKYGPEKE